MKENIEMLEKVKKRQKIVMWFWVSCMGLQVASLIYEIVIHNWGSALTSVAYISLGMLIVSLMCRGIKDTEFEIELSQLLSKESDALSISFDQCAALVKAICIAKQELLPYTHDRLHQVDEDVMKSIIARLDEALEEDRKKDKQLEEIIKSL